jgi:outer membrane protein W
MRFKTITHAIMIVLFLCHGIALAGDKGSSLISLSSGIITIDEFNGVTATSFMDIPSRYSTAAFLTYRYFVTDHIAIGVTAGIDDVEGNLTYGNPNVNGGIDGTAGTYIRHTCTIAPEVFIKYYQRHNAMLYGYAGAGYTLSKVEKAYSPEQYAAFYQNGVNTSSGGLPPYLSAQNPVYINENHFNAQLTAFGIRLGEKVAWDIEIGFGYKGLINTGLSVKL